MRFHLFPWFKVVPLNNLWILWGVMSVYQCLVKGMELSRSSRSSDKWRRKEKMGQMKLPGSSAQKSSSWEPTVSAVTPHPAPLWSPELLFSHGLLHGLLWLQRWFTEATSDVGTAEKHCLLLSPWRQVLRVTVVSPQQALAWYRLVIWLSSQSSPKNMETCLVIRGATPVWNSLEERMLAYFGQD